MSEKELTDYLDFSKNLAVEAGEVMKKYFSSNEAGTTWKSDLTPLTVADTTINSLVAEALKDKYPDHRLLGEEESIEIDSDYVWLCDPIDGTTPYSHGLPIATFNLALAFKGQVIVGVVFDPFMNRLYWASKGQGAYLNGKKLRINMEDKKEFSRETINFEIWGGNFNSIFKEADISQKVMDKLDRGKYSILSLISIAYSGMLIASGEVAGLLFSHKYPWDMAANSLIIEESGGVVTDVFGKKIERWDQHIDGVLAGRPNTHRALLEASLPILEKAERT